MLNIFFSIHRQSDDYNAEYQHKHKRAREIPIILLAFPPLQGSPDSLATRKLRENSAEKSLFCDENFSRNNKLKASNKKQLK